MIFLANKPTPGNAGWASRFYSERHWPGVPESGRSVAAFAHLATNGQPE